MKTSPALKLLFLLLAMTNIMGCRSSDQVPDPELFEPVEERPKTDPRTIVFHNDSVEMAELEVFVPAKPIEDCKAEAPHRLLCPLDYRQVVKERVYPRSRFSTSYPTELPLTCAQVWVRVRSKAMPPDTSREAIFLLPDGTDKHLALELGSGKAARLDQRGLGSRYMFPAPMRYCDPDQPEQTTAPREASRPREQIDRVVAALEKGVRACCKGIKCRGKKQLKVTLERDGTVLKSQVTTKGGGGDPKERPLTACLRQAVSQARFPGFTSAPTTAELVLKLP